MQYNKIAESYFKRRSDKTRFDFNRDIEVPAMIKMIGNVQNKSVLDVGCGFGDHIKYLSKQHPKKLVGFDISEELIKIARQNIPNCELSVADMSKNLKYEDSAFDVVFSSLAIQYIPKSNLKKLFSEVYRVLKKNGVFVFSTSHPIFNLKQKRFSEVVKQESQYLLIDRNYFSESQRVNPGSLKGIKFYVFTFETLIKTSLNAGFEIMDFKELKPAPSAKKYVAYKLLNNMPSFIMFKLRKK
jgi:ubiquinone/menaquinone biosynthesis C-methylase UbiE